MRNFYWPFFFTKRSLFVKNRDVSELNDLKIIEPISSENI